MMADNKQLQSSKAGIVKGSGSPWLAARLRFLQPPDLPNSKLIANFKAPNPIMIPNQHTLHFCLALSARVPDLFLGSPDCGASCGVAEHANVLQTSCWSAFSNRHGSGYEDYERSCQHETTMVVSARTTPHLSQNHRRLRDFHSCSNCMKQMTGCTHQVNKGLPFHFQSATISELSETSRLQF